MVKKHQIVQMISEWSCDTEDWSDDVENSGLHHGNKLHFKIEVVIIFQNGLKVNHFIKPVLIKH